jgi:hypothetical protein
MPALIGQVIMTVTDNTGAPLMIVTWFYDPVTFNLRDNPTTWVAATGQSFPAGTGAVICVNNTGGNARLIVLDNDGVTVIRQISIPQAGRAATATQLAALNPPYTTLADMAGMSFDVAAFNRH